MDYLPDPFFFKYKTGALSYLHVSDDVDLEYAIRNFHGFAFLCNMHILTISWFPDFLS